MKILAYIVLPVLLCTQVCKSNAQTSKTSSPIFTSESTSVNQTSLVADIFSTSGLTPNHLSGLVIVNQDQSNRRSSYQIYSDSTSGVKKFVNDVQSLDATVLFNTAYTNINSYDARPNIISSLTEINNGSSIEPGKTTFSSLNMSGTINLSNGMDLNKFFILHVKGDLNIADNTVFTMTKGTAFKNVYIYVDGSVTIGKNAFIPANFISQGDISVDMGSFTARLYSNGTVSLGSCVSVNILNDTDGDTVPDYMDDYPNVSSKSSDNIIPSQTVAFEDLWPSTGDFDMNDMVVACDYNLVTNAQNNLVEVVARYSLIATGGVLHNGFAVQFPMFNPSDVTVLEDPSLVASFGVLEPLEKNTTVINFFTDMRKEMIDWNTKTSADITHFSAPTTYAVCFKLKKPVPFNTVKTSLFDPFIFRYNGTSRIEIHLPGKQPTSLADTKLFKTGNDNTTPGTSNTYMTAKQLPFAIMLPTTVAKGFKYPLETHDVCKVYLNFQAWAQSGGTLSKDWYSNTAASYRNTPLIYAKPASIIK